MYYERNKMAYEIKIEEMLKSENRDNIKIFFDRVKNEINPETRINFILHCLKYYDGDFDTWVVDIKKHIVKRLKCN